MCSPYLPQLALFWMRARAQFGRRGLDRSRSVSSCTAVATKMRAPSAHAHGDTWRRDILLSAPRHAHPAVWVHRAAGAGLRIRSAPTRAYTTAGGTLQTHILARVMGIYCGARSEQAPQRTSHGSFISALQPRRECVRVDRRPKCCMRSHVVLWSTVLATSGALHNNTGLDGTET